MTIVKVQSESINCAYVVPTHLIIFKMGSGKIVQKKVLTNNNCFRQWVQLCRHTLI